GRARIERGQGAPHSDEDFLSHVLGGLPVANEAVREPENLAPVGLQNGCEGQIPAIRADELDDFAVRQHLVTVLSYLRVYTGRRPSRFHRRGEKSALAQKFAPA